MISSLNAYRQSNIGDQSSTDFYLQLPEVAYRTLSDKHTVIYVQDLYDAYRFVCETQGIIPLSWDTIIGHLSSISYSDHTGRAKKVISRAYIDEANPFWVIIKTKFDRISFISATYNSYKRWTQSLDLSSNDGSLSTFYSFRVLQTPSNFVGAIIILTIGDMLLVIWVIATKYQSYSSYLLMARSGAAIILYNLGLLLVHVSNIIQYIDHGLIWKLSTNKSDMIHMFLGFKIILGTILHIVGHCLHIPYVLDLCRDGCTYDQVHIVPKTNDVGTSISISWIYFIRLPAYYSGIILTGLIMIMCIGIALQRYGMIRMVTFYTHHRILSTIFSIGVILHGLQNLLGFNLSYIFVLPSLLIYIASRRSEIFYSHQLEIIRWSITNSSIQLYVANTPYMKHQLEYGLAISVFINHPQTSKLEWHPFTVVLSNRSTNFNPPCLEDTLPSESCIIIKKSGRWTTALIQNILNAGRGTSSQLINIGHIVPSCFRFHRFYASKLIFCSGIGITPFLAILSNIDPSNHVVLVWSIGTIDLIKQFGSTINQLHGIANLELIIFYSNSTKRLPRSITVEQWYKFNFIQTLIHYQTHIDIIHGIQIPWIIHLNRANPRTIISHYLSQMQSNQRILGIFICGSPSYTHTIVDASKALKFNVKKIQLDVWVEHL